MENVQILIVVDPINIIDEVNVLDSVSDVLREKILYLVGIVHH